MKKKINILLGALIALLSGCKTQNAPVRDNQIMVMYGPPSYFQQQAPQQDTPSVETTQEKQAEKNLATE
jgi:hypothetical protein